MKKVTIFVILILIGKVLIAQIDTLLTNESYKIYYYSNEKIASEGYMKNEKPVGFWKSFYITGILKSEGKWLNNKLDSIWIFYDQFGDTIEKINYFNGEKNGYDYKYYKNDESKNRIASKELYINGERSGNSYYYFQNGNIKKEVPYLNNKRQGLGFEYDVKGNIIEISRYRNNEIIVQENINRYNENNEKDGVWKEFYKNGNIKEEKTYLNGKLNGFVKIYSEDGKLIDAIKYQNGEVKIDEKGFESEIEIKEEYDKNENLVFQGSYKNNIPVGVHRFFNSNGNVIKSITYNIHGEKIAEGISLLNGNEDGEWKYFYDNEKLQAEGKYVDGKKTGKWNYYYKNGRIQQTGSYINGKLTGIWKWYYETGELLKEESYIYGKLDGEATEYSEIGNIISQGNYIEGKREGEWIYIVGDQKTIGKFVTDFKDGIWKSYYLETNTISFQGTYIQGNPDGKHVYYYPDGKIKEERYYSEGEKVRSWSKYDENGELILVVQYREGKEYKINGVKVKLDQNEN